MDCACRLCMSSSVDTESRANATRSATERRGANEGGSGMGVTSWMVQQVTKRAVAVVINEAP